MNRKLLHTKLVAASCLSAAMVLTAYSQALGPVQDHPDGPWYMPGEVLIKFKPTVTPGQFQEVIQAAGVIGGTNIQTAAMKARGDHGLTQGLTTRTVPQAIQALQNHPAVEFAQPNWVYKHHAIVDDQYFVDGSLWGMYGANTAPANAFGSGAAAAWASGSVGSKDVYIGVIDEGLKYDHADLAANVWVNPREIPGNGVDDDDNGYVDDIYGCNAIASNGDIFDEFYDNHGTHVSGTIGAMANNGVGVVGVNWHVNLISGKFLGPEGGTTLDAIEAIDYMTTLKKVKGINIVALNNSWGGGGYDAALLEVIVRAAQEDILFVASAGNGNFIGRAINLDSTPVYPACYNTTAAAGYDSVISVTAIDKTGAKPSWANYGKLNVDLGAPGVGIRSTVLDDGYSPYDGTSMAAPHVTGAIALYAAKYPGVKARDIRSALLKSTTATTSLSKTTLTGGRLDIPKFLNTAPDNWTPPTDKPAAPTGFTATPVSHSQIKLQWTDNSNDESQFEIIRTLSGVNTKITVPANVISHTDSGLTPDTLYSYSIQACNLAGCSGSAGPASATTLSAPSVVTATFVRSDVATQGSWINNYGALGYDIVAYEQAPTKGSISVGGQLETSWSGDMDQRALQTPDGQYRFAPCYYTFSNFVIDLDVSDIPYVSLYCVDYDRQLRQQTIQVIDPNYGTILDTQTIEGFSEGIYLTWEINGPVLIRVIWVNNTSSNGDNAVVSGIFLDETLPTLPAMPPAAPSGLTAKAISKSAINLNWTDNSNNETEFEIWRSTSATTGFAYIATLGVNANSYLDTIGLSANTTYYYHVRAVNSNGSSAYSNTASAKTLRR